MLAEIIAIGDELTSGQRLDTNSAWLSERLGELGLRVAFHTTVADDLAANVLVFRTALDRADLVIATGGLGPTDDDLTREAIAQAVGRELVPSAEALAHIEALFARRQRPMPQRNRKQALLPAGATLVPNPHGTAPGVDLTVPHAGRSVRLFALPGVPAEMKEMWQATVGPAAKAMSDGRVTVHHRIKVFGLGESECEARLPDLIRRGRVPQVGITVHQATITLRITATGDSREACRAAMQPTVDAIHAALDSHVYGEEDDELEHAVARLLNDRRQTLATAECGTGGLLAHWLSSPNVPANVYRGGRVERGEPGGLPPSLHVLAEQVRQQTAADYIVATGDFPAGESGDFTYGVLGPQGWHEHSSLFAGHPDILLARSGKQALNALRLRLMHS